MKRIVSLFLIVCLLASAIPALSLEVNAFDPEITGIGLYVDAPQIGKALPETAEIPSGYEGYYVASVSWYPQDATFQAGETYCVTVTVETENGYHFSTTDMLTYINEQKATVLSRSEDQYKISLEFAPVADDPDFIETTYTYEGEPCTRLEIRQHHPVAISVVCKLPEGATNVKYQWYTGTTAAQWGEALFGATSDTIQVNATELGTLYYRCQVTATLNGEPISSPSEEFNTVEVVVTDRGLPSMFFDDVSIFDWFYHDIEFVYYNELMNGMGNNLFSPNTTLTRGMLVTILYRLDGRPDIHSANPFKDINGEYYEKPVIWAYENGIVEGVGNGLFAPNQPITREQIATIFYRYAKYTDVYDEDDCVVLAGFADSSQISNWAYDSMSWAVGTGLIRGINDSQGRTYLQPQGNALRCQAAAILHRFVDTFIPAFQLS